MVIGTQDIKQIVHRIVQETPVADMHTHLFPPSFGSLLLWGIDELLTYHYLVAEVMRVAPMPYEEFWVMTKKDQADMIWNELFIKRSPISEACRGILTCLQMLDFDPKTRNLDQIRSFFHQQTIEDYIELVFEKSNVLYAVMTNDPFDAQERSAWESGAQIHPRLHTALRIDPLLMNWDTASSLLHEQGYEVSTALNESSISEIRRFLETWTDLMKPRYMAVSLPPSFAYPDESICTRILDSCILPFARERNLPFALMIGVKKLLNPGLRLAGDSVGRVDLSSVEQLCLRYPDNKFLVTLLSRENQHEICVIARKFNNLMPFGCWWFMNNPSIIDEITRERFELLGLSVIPQHSDARVLDQLLYKWPHSRRLIADVLVDKYSDLLQSGWNVSEDEIKRDVKLLFQDNFERFAPRNQ